MKRYPQKEATLSDKLLLAGLVALVLVLFTPILPLEENIRLILACAACIGVGRQLRIIFFH